MSLFRGPFPNQIPDQSNSTTPRPGILVGCCTARKNRKPHKSRRNDSPVLQSLPAYAPPADSMKPANEFSSTPIKSRQTWTVAYLWLSIAGGLTAVGIGITWLFSSSSADRPQKMRETPKSPEIVAASVTYEDQDIPKAVPVVKIHEQKPNAADHAVTEQYPPASLKTPTLVKPESESAEPHAGFYNRLSKLRQDLIVEKKLPPAKQLSPKPYPVSSKADNQGTPPASAPTADQPATETYGTCIHFYSTPEIAKQEAKKQQKLVMLLHVSGNFEESKFT